MNISNSDIEHYGSLEEAIRYKSDGTLTIPGYLDMSGCTGLEHFRITDIQDPRYYVAYKIPMADGLHICSGCRNLKIDDALEHWGKNYCGDRKIGDMYFVAIQNIKKESEKCA
jgi:hypothetical protein